MVPLLILVFDRKLVPTSVHLLMTLMRICTNPINTNHDVDVWTLVNYADTTINGNGNNNELRVEMWSLLTSTYLYPMKRLWHYLASKTLSTPTFLSQTSVTQRLPQVMHDGMKFQGIGSVPGPDFSIVFRARGVPVLLPVLEMAMRT